MMFLSNTRFLIYLVILLAVFCNASECKRGGGARRGSMTRGSSVLGRSRQSQGHDVRNNQRKSKSQPAEDDLGKIPADVPDPSKPSAPSPSKTDATKLSSKNDHSPQTAGNAQQRPIGWDVGQGAQPDNAAKNIGWNTGNNNNPLHPTGSGGNPPPYSRGGADSPLYSSGSVGNPPPYSSGNVGNPPPYSSGGVGNPPPYSSGGVGKPPPYSNIGVGNPPPPYPGLGTYHGQGQYSSNTGFMPQPGSYSPHMGGYGSAPIGGGGFYGSNKYNKHGYGGYGGFGGHPGFGGYGMGGYGKKFGGGFGMGFGKHAVRNVVMGLLVWHLISGLTHRPYYVYNYHNNPEKVPHEIPLPANTVLLCADNVTSLCAPNTAPLCTSDGAIMCVVLAQKTVPCDDNSTMKCVSSTAACVDDDDKPCDTKNQTSTSVHIPCVTNATIIGKVKNDAVSELSTGDKTELCVTTLALPQPEEDRQAFNQTCQIDSAANLENKNSTTCITTMQHSNVTTETVVEKTNSKDAESS